METCVCALPIAPCCNHGAVESSISTHCIPTNRFKRLDLGRKRFIGEVWRNAVKMSGQRHSSRVFAVSKVSSPQTKTSRGISKVKEQDKLSKYLFRTEIGGELKVFIRKKNGKYSVNIEVSLAELSDSRLSLIWGIYRSDSSSFMQLDSQQSDERTVGTPFIQNSVGSFALELEFEAKQTPFYLLFVLKRISNAELSESEVRNHKKKNFCVPIGFDPGYPAPLGLSFSSDGSMNFAFFSRNAQRVVLCFYDDTTAGKPSLELDLDPYVNRTGDVWHASLDGAWTYQSYGYQCKGSNSKADADESVLDPYAKIAVNSTIDGGFKYLGRLCEEPSFDWSGDIRPDLPLEKLFVYKLNVKRFTEHKSSQLYSDVAGTFAGLEEKISHFKDLGINAVLLEPIFPFDDEKGPYYPFHFFSPTNIYGPSAGSISAITSMKEMVKKLHANGMEVLLEVVFSHTADMGALHGIDKSSYYFADRVTDLESRNALNCNYPITQRLILDSLHHWVTEYHVDGFCFVNSSSLTRGFYGEYLSRPPLVEAISFDPILSKTKIIADCWDPRDMSAKEIVFPHWKRWAEMNTKFCHDVRNFLRGEGLISDLATRLCGSGDIFSSGRGPAFSLNFIARNVGLPLVDLVSFSAGDLASELSWNCGEEGPTKKIPVLERRLKQIRNFLFILCVSLGVPVLNMGDEYGQSSGGSTSYDDRKSFDWNALSTGFAVQTTQFISFLSSLRTRRSDLLQRKNFMKVENIDWHGSNHSPPRWEDPSCKFLAMTLKADIAETESPKTSEASHVNGDLFIAFNAAGHSENVALPPVPEGMAWHRLVDTALPFPSFFSDDGELIIEQMKGLVVYEVKSHSCALFEAKSHKG